MKTEIVKDIEGCGYLLAAILRQTIQDYVGVKRLMLQHRTVSHRFGWESRLKSCEKFFNDPPYDYGDVDFVLVKRLCDERAVEGKRVQYKDIDKRWN